MFQKTPNTIVYVVEQNKEETKVEPDKSGMCVVF